MTLKDVEIEPNVVKDCTKNCTRYLSIDTVTLIFHAVGFIAYFITPLGLLLKLILSNI